MRSLAFHLPRQAGLGFWSRQHFYTPRPGFSAISFVEQSCEELQARGPVELGGDSAQGIGHVHRFDKSAAPPSSARRLGVRFHFADLVITNGRPECGFLFFRSAARRNRLSD